MKMKEKKSRKCSVWDICLESLKRTIFTYKFIVLGLVLMILLLFATILNMDDGTEVNAFLMLFVWDKETLLQDPTNSFLNVMLNIKSGYFLNFAPLIVCLALLPILTEEKECGIYRYFLVRSSKWKMIVGKLIASLFCGGILVCASYVLIGIVLYFKLPHGSDFPGIEIVFIYSEWLPESFFDLSLQQQHILWFVKNCFGVFCFGMANAFWAYLLSAFVRNAYFIVCIPYIFIDFLEKKISGLSIMGKLEEGSLLSIVKYIFPSNALEIGTIRKGTIYLILSYFCFSILAVILQKYSMERRKDCGT